jgi:hypothetical protein
MTDETKGIKEGSAGTGASDSAPDPQSGDKKPRSKWKIVLGVVILLLLAIGAVIFMPAIKSILTQGKLEVVRRQRLIRERRERADLLEELKNEKNAIERIRLALAAEIELDYKPAEVDLEKYGPDLRSEYQKVIKIKQDYEKRRLLLEKSTFVELVKLGEQELQQIRENSTAVEDPSFNDWLRARKAVVDLQLLVDLDYGAADPVEKGLIRQVVVLEFEKKLTGEGLTSGQYLALQQKYPDKVADYLKGER